LPLERFEVSTMYDVKSPKAEEFILIIFNSGPSRVVI